MGNMKKLFFALSLMAAAVSAQAGGLLHNTNQHIAFQRMMARGASHEIDAVFTNPAGVAFMKHDGRFETAFCADAVGSFSSKNRCTRQEYGCEA